MSQYTDYKIESYIVKYVTSYPKILLRGLPTSPIFEQRMRYIGELSFLPDESTLPPDSLSDLNGWAFINLSFHIPHFHNIIDVLRNEGPLRLEYTGDGGALLNNNGIYSFLESVGEGDGKATGEYIPHPEVPA